jgi:hypothetical protein
MCCDSPSDGALLLHEIMVAGPMELPVTPPSLCSRFDERACCQPSPGPSNLGWPKPPPCMHYDAEESGAERQFLARSNQARARPDDCSLLQCPIGALAPATAPPHLDSMPMAPALARQPIEQAICQHVTAARFASRPIESDRYRFRNARAFDSFKEGHKRPIGGSGFDADGPCSNEPVNRLAHRGNETCLTCKPHHHQTRPRNPPNFPHSDFRPNDSQQHKRPRHCQGHPWHPEHPGHQRTASSRSCHCRARLQRDPRCRANSSSEGQTRRPRRQARSN